MLQPSSLTLGILAGGRASRLGGCDKAWIERDGTAQVLRWRDVFGLQVGTVLVSANRDPDRYGRAGLAAVPDRVSGGIGPLGGLDALAASCTTPWLLTLPVDSVGMPSNLIDRLFGHRGEHGAYARDRQGRQPLVALWRTHALKDAMVEAIALHDRSVQALQSRMKMKECTFADIEFGNLNTPGDLLAAGIDWRHG